MKNYLLIFLGSLGLLISSITNAQTNLISNGDLEDGESHEFTDWNTGTNIRQEISYYINGSRSVRLAGVSASVWFYQDVEVEEGVTYTLTYSGRIQDAAGGSGTQTSTDKILVGRVRAGTTSGDWTEVANITSSTDETVSGTYNVPEGISTLRIQVGKVSGIGYADDIKFERYL